MIPSDETLDRLIRATQHGESPGFHPPNEAILRRYLLGTASVAERHVVREAMEQSSTFRGDMLELAEAVDNAIDQARSGNLRAAGTPDGQLPEWLKRALETSHGSRAAERKEVHAEAPFLRRLRLPIAVPAFALALLALLLISRAPNPSHGNSTWELMSPGVEKELLISMNTRAGAGSSAISGSSPQEIAIAAFRSALKLGASGEFEFQAPRGSAATEPTQSIILKSPGGSDLAQIRLAVPDRAEMSAWILTLPDRSLRVAQFDAAGRAIIWNPEWGRRGVVTFIYHEGAQYHSPSPGYFSF